MGAMSQEEINRDLFDEVISLKKQLILYHDTMVEINSMIDDKVWNEGLELTIQEKIQNVLDK